MRYAYHNTFGMEYAVRAETHEGNEITLRRGFVSQDAAEDHPVTLSLWKRVWVQAISPTPRPPTTLPPLPWGRTISNHPTANARYHAYLIDANGRKIAAIWGRDGEKELTADFILRAVTAYQQSTVRK